MELTREPRANLYGTYMELTRKPITSLYGIYSELIGTTLINRSIIETY
jgi:hypothetical protein